MWSHCCTFYFRCLQFLFRRYLPKLSHISTYNYLIGNSLFLLFSNYVFFRLKATHIKLLMHCYLMLLQPSSTSRVLHIQQRGIREIWVSWIRAVVLPSKRRGTLLLSSWAFFRITSFPLLKHSATFAYFILDSSHVTSWHIPSIPGLMIPLLSVCWLVMGWTQTCEAGCWILGMFLQPCY